MHRSWIVVLAVAFALGAAACGGASDSPGTTPSGRRTLEVDESAPDEEKVVAMIEGLAADVTASSGDCGKVAGAIVGWVDKHSARIAELTQRVEAGDSGISGAKVDELDARMDRAWDAVFASAKPCETQARPALNRLDAMFGL
jgi:hypothetical protein